MNIIDSIRTGADNVLMAVERVNRYNPKIAALSRVAAASFGALAAAYYYTGSSLAFSGCLMGAGVLSLAIIPIVYAVLFNNRYEGTPLVQEPLPPPAPPVQPVPEIKQEKKPKDKLAWREQSELTDFSSLRSLDSLKHLDVSETNLQKDDLNHIAALTNLVELNLSHTCGQEIADARQLTTIANLNKLTCTNVNFDPLTVHSFSKLTELRFLELNYNALESQHISTFGELKNLEILNLNGTSIDDRFAENVKKMSSLNKLLILRTDITDAFLNSLGEMPKLKILSIEHTKCTQEGIQAFRLKNPNMFIFHTAHN